MAKVLKYAIGLDIAKEKFIGRVDRTPNLIEETSSAEREERWSNTLNDL